MNLLVFCDSPLFGKRRKTNVTHALESSFHVLFCLGCPDGGVESPGGGWAASRTLAALGGVSFFEPKLDALIGKRRPGLLFRYFNISFQQKTVRTKASDEGDNENQKW